MEMVLILFLVFKLTKEVQLTTVTVKYDQPSIIERNFKVGDSIKINYDVRYTYLIVLGKPKFYLNVQLSSQRKFHSTTPGLYALGQTGGAEYTALEAGVHKLFIWTFSQSYCKYILAYGKHEYNKDRVISASPWAFIETDPDKEMRIKSDKLADFTWVHWYEGDTSNEIDSNWGPFDETVSRLVLVIANNKVEVNVQITSDGNSIYDYGEYDQDGLDASTVPFYYTSQDKKQNMLDNYYVPPQEPDNPPIDSSSSPNDPVNPPGDSNPPPNDGNKPTEKPGDDDSDSDDDGLSGGAWAGIGTAIAGGGGGISTGIVYLVKWLKKKDEDSSGGEDDGKNVAKSNNDIENKNEQNTKIDNSHSGNINVGNQNNNITIENHVHLRKEDLKKIFDEENP